MESLLETASDATRLKIMFALLDDDECECEECNCGVCESLNCMIEKCFNDIAFEIEASQSLVSHQLKVLKAFIDAKISESHFFESTGYGYNDLGRDKIDEVFSKVFNTFIYFYSSFTIYWFSIKHFNCSI